MNVTTLYYAYQTALKSLSMAKEEMKRLQIAGEDAARTARITCKGSVDEKVQAICAAWEPFNRKIAKVEYSIGLLRIQVDQAWQAYEEMS
ncbi:MAG TPA: hypothetical protein VHV10_05065 [Ktedonobacteraceae bacterium]|jgi:hypothetical protein|nr:hypothetical protein [Ktedonobacteraceae bacterium]